MNKNRFAIAMILVSCAVALTGGCAQKKISCYDTRPVKQYTASDVEKLLKEGDGLLKVNRIDLAQKRYQKALEIDPGNARAIRGIKAANAEREKYSRGIGPY